MLLPAITRALPGWGEFGAPLTTVINTFTLVDPTASKDFLGRVGGEGKAAGRLGLAGGISALWGTGFHRGTASTKDSVVWRDSNGDGQVDPSELVGLPGQPAKHG